MIRCNRFECNKISIFPLHVYESSTVWNFCSQRCSDMFFGSNYKYYKVLGNNNNYYFIWAYDEKELKEKMKREKVKIISYSIKE